MINFKEQIEAMNKMYNLEIEDAPMLLHNWKDRLCKFKKTLLDEIDEVDEIINSSINEDDILVNLADWFGDIIVFCRSEAMKYGIPLEEVINLIMESNMSKLGIDGKPIYDENGKFLKGPNYWKPEEKIKMMFDDIWIEDTMCGNRIY